MLEIKWDPKISSNDIAVAAKDDVVSLTGFVPSYWEKEGAEKAAKRVYGVRGVANDLEVQLPRERTDARRITVEAAGGTVGSTESKATGDQREPVESVKGDSEPMEWVTDRLMDVHLQRDGPGPYVTEYNRS